MLLLLQKIGYIILILGINLYVVSFLNNKIVSRIELRRGYKGYKRGGLGFPFSSSLKYIAKAVPFSIWDIFIFVFSIILWSFIPISHNLYIIDSEHNLFFALSLYMILVIFRIFSVSYSNYNFIISEFIKKTVQILSFILPLVFSVLGIIILNKSLDFKIIVNSQYQLWNVVYQPIGFIVFFMSVLFQVKLMNLTENNQFLITNNMSKEGEGITRLVSRFSNYLIIFFLISMMNILYLGGWQRLSVISGDIMVGIKFYLVFAVLVLLERAISGVSSLNKLINLNYKLLMPLSIVNLLITIVFFILRNVYFII